MATHTRHHRNTVTEAAVVDALSRHVAEIAFGIVEVVRVVVEEPRCKVSVTTTQPGVPAAAVCIGKAGAVARAVARDIGLEMVGIVTYSPDITTYLSNAISAHNVSPISVEVTDILSRKARMVFDNEPSAAGPSQLARAIGARDPTSDLPQDSRAGISNCAHPTVSPAATATTSRGTARHCRSPHDNTIRKCRGVAGRRLRLAAVRAWHHLVVECLAGRPRHDPRHGAADPCYRPLRARHQAARRVRHRLHCHRWCSSHRRQERHVGTPLTARPLA